AGGPEWRREWPEDKKRWCCSHTAIPFEELDLDKDGSVVAAELVAAAATRDVAATMQQLDLDADGAVTQEEFVWPGCDAPAEAFDCGGPRCP
ncbi:unnamed protein product, partial [Prorocentrum cordatum]